MKDNIKKTLENDGFVVIEDFLSEKEVEEMKEEAGNLIKSMPERSKRTVFSTKDAENQQNRDKYFLDSGNNISYFFEAGALDGEGNLLVDSKVSLNKIGHALHSLIPVFRKVSLSEKVKECAFQLGFQDPAICQSMYIFKNPGIGSEGNVKVHEDCAVYC
ncbi:hypothetical protein HUJ04_008843 [Dendroctonus ponderosae]|nr:hypothetical protein HUJ04_008843 [Dendroctonus ponderosae]